MDRTWPWRLAIGLTVLAGFLARDLLRPNRSYARLKEYAFLFGSGLAAAAIGVLHDRVTYELCPDYYVVGKGIASASLGFNTEVMLMAFEAAWSVGLFVGLVLLVLNRPRADRPQLAYPDLVRLLRWPLGISIAAACVLGWLGKLSHAWLASQLGLQYLPIHSPQMFCTVSGIHMGTYLGVLVGTFRAAVLLRRVQGVPDA